MLVQMKSHSHSQLYKLQLDLGALLHSPYQCYQLGEFVTRSVNFPDPLADLNCQKRLPTRPVTFLGVSKNVGIEPNTF